MSLDNSFNEFCCKEKKQRIFVYILILGERIPYLYADENDPAGRKKLKMQEGENLEEQYP